MILTLAGENEFAIRQKLRTIVADFVQQYGPHGVERVDGELIEPLVLPSLLQGATLFTPQRLVVLRGAAANKSVWEALGDWVDKVPADTTLVVVEPAPDKRTRTYKLLKSKTQFVECAQPSDSELAKWLRQSATDMDGDISQPDAQYLIERVGRDQWRLSEEIAKVVSYEPKVTRQAIDELVEPHPEGNAFALLDASLAGDSAKVAAMVAQLKTEEDPYKLFGLLASQVHALALVGFAGTRSADQIAKDAGLHPFVVRKTQALAKKMGQTKIRAVAAHVASCDVQLKSTGADPWQLLEVTLQRVAI